MTICKRDYKAMKYMKSQMRKIGNRSIHDIIHDRPVFLTYDQKISYIRHHFVYYEGNYDFFYNKDGKPNEKKFELNNLIHDIVTGKKDPEELSEFNKQLIIWRKNNPILTIEDKEFLEFCKRSEAFKSTNLSSFDYNNALKYFDIKYFGLSPYAVLFLKLAYSLEINKEIVAELNQKQMRQIGKQLKNVDYLTLSKNSLTNMIFSKIIQNAENENEFYIYLDNVELDNTLKENIKEAAAKHFDQIARGKLKRKHYYG